MSCSDRRCWRSCLVGLALLGGWLGGRAARADDNHYQNYLVGERAVGLGGAFTAIADDSSGAYFNPAGLAETDRSSISLSAAVYGFASESVTIPSVGFDAGQTSFVSYPTTAAWIQRVRKGGRDGAGRIQLALSLITPRSVVRRRRSVFQLAEQSDPGSGQTLSSDNIAIESAEDDSLWIGLSAALKLGRRLSLGATLFTTLRSGIYHFYQTKLYRLFQGAQEVDRVALPTRLESKISHIGLLGVVGGLLTITDRLRLGLSFRTPLLPLRDKVELSLIAVESAGAGGGFRVSSTDAEASFTDRQPWKATVGLAFVKARTYGASLDFSLYGPVGEYQMISGSGSAAVDRAYPMKKRLLWQLNVGGEIYLARALALRAGFFTNLSSLSPCEGAPSCNEIFADAVDRLGVSGSVGYEIERATITLGWSYSFGASTATPQGIEIDTRRSFLFFVLGGSFRF